MLLAKIQICILAIAMLQDGYPLDCVECQPQHVVPAPSGLVIAIDPDALIGEGLIQEWHCINEEFDQRQIESKPFSKVRFQLTPKPSIGAAVVRVYMSGSSVGESSATSKKVEIVSDTLTNFEACQKFFLSANGVGHNEPHVKVDSNTSVKKMNAGRHLLAGAFTKAGIKHAPKQVKQTADKFAQYQIEKSLRLSVMQMLQEMQNQLVQFSYKNPMLAGLDWQFSSDEQRIYLAANSFVGPVGGPRHSPMPVIVAVDEFFANEFCNSQWSGRTVNSDQFAAMTSRFTNRTRGQYSATAINKEWSLTFSDTPFQLEFDHNCIRATLSLDSFQADDRQLPGARIGLEYILGYYDGRYYLQRDEAIEINGDYSGARQQIVRSIMRKRLESAIPKLIPIPDLPPNPQLQSKDLDLSVARIALNPQNLTLELDHRKTYGYR